VSGATERATDHTITVDLPDFVHRLPLQFPDLAVQEYATLVGALRGVGGTADLEAVAAEAVDTAVRAGAVLMALVIPPAAAPAVLTGVLVDPPAGWDGDSVATLRDAMEDVGGPDVRETLVLDTDLGPAVVAQRVPGVEQARARRPLTYQLQAFLPTGDGLLLLTLASPANHGWEAHQLAFCQVVASARDGARRPVRVPAYEQDDDSYENHTYRL
jgi:hypothetical protein